MANYAKFKAFLAEKGIKQQEVADLIGMNRVTLNLILNGQRGADFKGQDIAKICKEYHIEASDYFFKAKVASSQPERSDAVVIHILANGQRVERGYIVSYHLSPLFMRV